MTYLFSSFTGLPDRFFHGYAFDGADFISGQEGAAQFFRATGRRIDSGQDGCYLTLWRTENGHRAGVDAGGLKKIFWYDNGRVWGFSNSVVALARHLSEQGVRLEPDPVQIESLRVGNVTVATQLACFETLIRGIRLLPSWNDLEITDAGLRPLPRSAGLPRGYGEMLADHVELWLRRFETLLADPRIRLSCDLTGGKDSRTVFALIWKARERLGTEARARVSFLSGTAPRWAKDLEAAQGLAAHFGLKLNPPAAPSPSRMPRTADRVFELWRDLNLGLYFPVYFLSPWQDAFAIHLHGGGGEKHRPFYRFTDDEDFARRVLQKQDGNPLIRTWVERVGETLTELQERVPGMDPWILHYREFRNRMHAGRSPQYRTVLAPLDGRELEIMSAFEGKAEQAQVHFDIMESLFPGLSGFPYDDPAKGPSPEALRALTLVQVGRNSAPGMVHIAPDPLGDNRPESGRTPLELLQEDFARAAARKAGKHMPEVLKAGKTAMAAAVAGGKFDHASDARPVSRLLAANFALSFT